MQLIYRKIFELATPFLKKARPEDVLHTKVVVSLMKEIVEGEGLEREADVLIPAAILHDIGWSQISEEDKVKRSPEARFKHMREGVKIARKILGRLDYSQPKIKRVCQLISIHDNQYVELPVKDELAKRLIEADNLWILSKEAFDYYCEREKWSRSFLLEKQKVHVRKYKSTKSPTAIRIKERLIGEREKEAKNG
jgi:putative nucleotidyltransferase with HDIG domain